MAFTSNEINLKRLVHPSALSLFSRLSLRSVKGIAVFFLLASVGGFLLLWQPAYLQLRFLQKEETHWQQILRTGDTNNKTGTMAATIPTMDQLPDIIEQCRGVFINEGVDVVSLNVERFGERRKIGNEPSLDFALVRLHFRGNWEGIVRSLQTLEEKQEGNIHLQEVVLDAEGGEALLQIYLAMGVG